MNQEPLAEKIAIQDFEAFAYDGDIWVEATPANLLLNSHTIHDIVSRGDVFAVRLRDSHLTVLPHSSTLFRFRVALPKTVTLVF